MERGGGGVGDEGDKVQWTRTLNTRNQMLVYPVERFSPLPTPPPLISPLSLPLLPPTRPYSLPIYFGRVRWCLGRGGVS